jgi:hypothetical protein
MVGLTIQLIAIENNFFAKMPRSKPIQIDKLISVPEHFIFVMPGDRWSLSTTVKLTIN